jgi:hypothetical protein
MVVQRVLNTPACGPRALTAQTVHAISLSRPEVPFLNVVVGPPTEETYGVEHSLPVEPRQECHGDVCVGPITGWTEVHSAFTWEWTARCEGQACTLSIGPKSAKPAAVYRWSPRTLRASGPPGSAASGFLRFGARDEDKAINNLSAASGYPQSCEEARNPGCPAQ